MQEKLILARKQRGITQKELSKKLGITVKQYGVKEAGKAKFNGDEMFIISKYFDMKIEDLFLPTYHQIGD